MAQFPQMKLFVVENYSNAGEMIAEGVLAIEMGANVSDLKLSIHAHPTLTETMMEAAESFFG